MNALDTPSPKSNARGGKNSGRKRTIGVMHRPEKKDKPYSVNILTDKGMRHIGRFETRAIADEKYKRAIYRRDHKGESKVCDQCGKEFVPSHQATDKVRFCTIPCQRKYFSERRVSRKTRIIDSRNDLLQMEWR